MKMFNVIIVFYMLVSVVVGVLLVGFSSHLIEVNEIILRVNDLYTNDHARISLATSGVALVLIAFLYAQLASGRREREKTIAFNNPSGQVTITLFAVEDLIRKIGHELAPIKEIKPDVVATKKRGLLVRIRLILKTAVNIPEFTAQLQEMVRTRMQDTLGIEEQITVKIHIAKILTQQEKAKKGKEESEAAPHEEIPVPFLRQ